MMHAATAAHKNNNYNNNNTKTRSAALLGGREFNGPLGLQSDCVVMIRLRVPTQDQEGGRSDLHTSHH